MKIESKEVVTLTNEEKKMINDTYMLICEIMETTNNEKLCETVRNLVSSMEKFSDIVDCEVDK